MTPPTSLELKLSPLQKVFSLAAVLGFMALVPGRILWVSWHSPRGLSAANVVLTIFLVGIICWWLYGGARSMWFETGLYLRVDEQEVAVKTRQGNQTLHWDEIYSLTRDNRSLTGESGQWFSLRGGDEQVLAQWDRNWCRFTSGQIRRCDDITTFIEERLEALGRLQKEENAASQLWESLQPLGKSEGVMVRTNYNWIGWVGIILWLPCAFFSWSSPKGGPIIALVFLFFAALSIYIISSQALLFVDDEKIEARSIYGLCRMQWHEVNRVSLDEQGNTLSLLGDSRRLCFTGPGYWKQDRGGEMLLYLTAICEKQGIPFDTNAKPIWGGSKNCKVRNQRTIG